MGHRHSGEHGGQHSGGHNGGHATVRRHLLPHRRLSLLVGTAALGALGFAVIAPSADAAAAGDVVNRQADLILAGESFQRTAGDPAADDDSSSRAASAVAQAQARSRTLAAASAVAQARDAAPAAPAFPATRDGYRAYAKSKVGAAQFSCLDPLWTRESSWRPAAKNPSSTAYGIAQLLDSTWRYTGVAKTSDGFRQVDAGLAYLSAAYPGGPCGAWSHEKSKGWY